MIETPTLMFVSCQANKNSNLNKPRILLAIAQEIISAGANGVRAEGVNNLKLMHGKICFPIISLIKSYFDDGSICITRKITQVDELVQIGANLIAIDGTNRIHEDLTGPEFISQVKTKFPHVEIIADISTLDEAKASLDAGSNFVATTLRGYTPWTISNDNNNFDFNFFELLCSVCNTNHIIAEGRINRPELIPDIIKYNPYGIVVGNAITNPAFICTKFMNFLN